jgi:DNA-binding transcriptional ArsR family regulator
MTKKIVKENPISQITLRKYEKPANLSKREIIKKICLSFGLLQPGDSRDVIVDILSILIQHKKGLPLYKIEELVIKNRKKLKLEIIGVHQSNISRQLRRLKELYIIERYLETYRISEGQSLTEIFEEKIIKFHIKSITERIKEYLEIIDKK